MSLDTVNVALLLWSKHQKRPWKRQRLLTPPSGLYIKTSLSGATSRLRFGMSTTRPLLGMRRVTELMCQEQPSSRLTAAAARQQLETPTVDEFTVLEEKENELKAAKPRVEQVFKVTFTIIGLLDHTRLPLGSQTSRQIWLQLIGNTDDVSKAKVRSC